MLNQSTKQYSSISSTKKETALKASGKEEINIRINEQRF